MAVPAVSESSDTEADLAAARAVFQANLEAIRNQDAAAYLDCYLQSDGLARTGPTGFVLGYEGLAATAGQGWPEVFEAQDLRLTPIRSGMVYGSYRYRVRFDGAEQSGLSERLFVETSDGWKIAVTTAFPSLPGVPPPPRALVGATLVDGTGADPIVDAVVLVRDGRVECAGSAAECPVPEGVEEVDLSGRWIAPGLVDSHVHFSQTGFVDGRPDFVDLRSKYPYEQVQGRLQAEPERFLSAYLCSGVTAVFDVGGYPWTWEMRDRYAGSTEAPHIAAAGPLLSTLDFWLNLPAEKQFIYLGHKGDGRSGVKYLDERGADAVKVWFIPTQDREFEVMSTVVTDVGKRARRAELPLIVHATGLREAKVAVAAGAHLLVHSVWDQPVDDGLVALLMEKGTIYSPTLTVAAGYLRLAAAAVAGEAPEIDDPNRCVDSWTREKVAYIGKMGSQGFSEERVVAMRARTSERERIAAENLLLLARAGVPIAMGTDAGNPLTLHGPSVYAEMEAMQAAGLSAAEVVVASTLNGARAMGRESEIGSVESGKVADLVVLTADPTLDIAAFRRLTHVMRGGVLRPIEEFRAPK